MDKTDDKAGRNVLNELLRAIIILRELHDIQNGPPLVRDTEEWDDIMRRARQVLEDNEPHLNLDVVEVQ